MRIKLRSKVWKQITKKNYSKLASEGEEVGCFVDSWGEISYFEVVEKWTKPSQKTGRKE